MSSYWWHKELEKQGKLVEAQRVWQRTMFDLEMIKKSATATASRTIRAISPAGCRESLRRRCSTICRRMRCCSSMKAIRPFRRFGGMYHGDRSRKENLVNYGFRLPSALDNRPLTFEEFREPRASDHLRVRHAGAV